MPVSELEKNPDKRMSATRTENKRPSGASFNAGVNLITERRRYLEEKPWRGQALDCGLTVVHCGPNSDQNQLQYHLGAKVGQHQQAKASEGESHGCLTAPPQLIAAPKQ